MDRLATYSAIVGAKDRWGMSEETYEALAKALRECGAESAVVRVSKDAVRPKYRASDKGL